MRDFSAKQHGKSINPAGPAAKTGTGFFVTADGHLLTSYHLIANAKHIEVRTGAAKHLARVVKIDPANGLALLHIKARSTPLRLGISRAIALGEPVFSPVSKAIKPDAAEIERNPRARSSVLRHAVRTATPAREAA